MKIIIGQNKKLTPMKKLNKNKLILERADKIEKLLSENDFLLCKEYNIDQNKIKKTSLEMAIIQINKETR